ncbi:MAG: hypothetical protein ABWZ52_08560 [Acidimicrobiales bacterium]
MGKVILRCRSCGLDIPADADGCPACAHAAVPPRAAGQRAGVALPTRSVHALPTVPPRRARPVRPLGPARTARSAFSVTTVCALLTLAAAGLAWLANQPRFVLQVPEGTVDLLDDITTTAGRVAIAALAIGLVAMVVWCVRAAGRAIRNQVSEPR